MYSVRGSILLPLLIFVAIAFVVEGGSQCPSREDIYPCMCSSVMQTKKLMYTIINCGHLPNTDSLRSIFKTLRQMHIDRFIIYDSFWETKKLGDLADQNRKLPENWITMLRIKELEIVDSVLSPCFACDSTIPCVNSVSTHFTVINSSDSDTICTECIKTNKGKLYWIACMSKLQHFHFVDNRITDVNDTFFARPMKELKLLNMSHNRITRIGKKAFQNMPKLESLDLSHNLINSITEQIFGTATTSIKFIDLSWNQIKSLSEDIFQLTPNLRTFLASNNDITKLPETVWKDISKEIRTIDLEENPIDCDCHMIWINTTFAVHVSLLGACTNEEYETSPLRRVSRFMAERCEDGIIKTRNNLTKPSYGKTDSKFQDPKQNFFNFVPKTGGDIGG